MTVFANGLEIACKAQANKVIAAFPYVCMTPPQTPATPPGVPVPYPTFGMDSDTDKGTSTVKIGGETVTQKDKSYYTKCTGNEAGAAPMKNVVTSVNTGKEYAHAWSGDVKMDGEPISRFSDIASNDHASPTAGGPPFPKIGKPGIGAAPDMEDCLVGSYDEIVKKCNKAKGEAHHIVPDKAFRTGTRAQAEAGVTDNRIAKAPSLGQGVCICLAPGAHDDIHKTEREKLNALGKKVIEGKTGAALDAAKKTAEYGTADIADIHAGCQDSLNSLNPDDDDAIGECIKIAKQKVAEQSDKFAPGQTGRTSNSLPNEKAGAKMLPGP